MIYILLIGLILELIYCYYVFKKDLFSPSAILCEVFILSTIACIFNVEKWGVDLGFSTVATILGGNAVFIFVSTIVHHFYEKKYHKIKNEKSDKNEKMSYIKISGVVLALVTIVYIIFSVVYVKTNISILGDLTQSEDMSQAMSVYRHETVHEDENLLPVWLIRTNAVFNIGTYVLMYVFINNIIVDKRKKSNYLLLLSILLYLVSSVFTAQRTTILLAFIYALFVTYSLLNRKHQFVRKLNTKYVIRGALIIVAFLVLFGVTRSFFGRSDKDSAFENVTYYTGNSIESLDLYIRNPLESKQFGEETFWRFRSNLSKYGLAEGTISKTSFLEFRRDAKNNVAGNVYTGYRSYIHDFGYFSIILFQAILALFYSIWYERLRCKPMKSGINLNFILYAWFCLALFRFSITNEVFSRMAQFIFLYWLLFLGWKILLNLKLSFKRGAAKPIEKGKMYVKEEESGMPIHS